MALHEWLIYHPPVQYAHCGPYALLASAATQVDAEVGSHPVVVG